eukprot:TRINITY_DN20955_c0_g1_i1.p1 TRINITY_DN20955_c0_g1~~TRINITY_DN20955_c0_g1_i1.p1  ORF type:complete len:666 (+),score=310.52 TRINITY_DN20955_c0_g1_i1:82-1998(+)
MGDDGDRPAALPPLPDDFGEESVVVCSRFAQPCRAVVESCGSPFDTALLSWLPKKRKQGQARAEAKPDAERKSKGGAASKKKKRFTSTKLSDQEQEGDHYEVLGLEDKDIEATEDEIRAAYKEKCIQTHPDKTGGDDRLFKAVQLAAEVLLNADKRRAYDSSLPFDDDIPSAKTAPEKYFKEFGECFARNARWCAQGRAACPPFGDDSAPMEQVDAFYSFWFGFQSWRDFSAEVADDMHDTQEAEDRFERRWMEKENAKAVEKMKKAEKARVRELVDRAYKLDPRIRRRQQEEQAAKEAAREARREQEEQRLRKEREEQERQQREEEQRRAERKEMLAQLKKARQQFRKTTKDWPESGGAVGVSCVARKHLEWLLTKLELEDIGRCQQAADDAAGGKPDAAIQFVYGLIAQTEERTQESRNGGPLHPEAKKKEEAEKKEKEAQAQQAQVSWTEAEMLELQKACVKYPAGTVDRWRKLADFMGHKKSPDQILKKVKQLELEYRMPQQVAPGKGLRSVGQKLPELPAAQQKSQDTKFNEQDRWYRDTPERHFDAAAEEAYLKKQAPAAGAAAAAAGDADADELSDIWSAAQQKQLEGVLRDLKAYKEKDKWDKIAAQVEGKTKKQCVARYKFLCAAQKKK